MGKNYRVSLTGASASHRRYLASSVRVDHEVGSAIRAATVLVALAVAAGCLARSTARESISRDVSAHTIWVIDHGWHTAIVVRRSAVDTTIWPEVDDFPDAAFVEVAWGDRDFYMADRGTAWLAVKAAFLTSGSVLHVVGFGAPLEAHFPGNDVVGFEVSRRGFDAMTRLFHEEYQRDEQSRPVRLAPGLYGASWFYSARSRYHLFNTCNTWVARALRAAGLDLAPAGTVTAGGVMQEARRAAASR
jgi:uncharacterized protein (TIGR02117 family)